MTPVSEKNLAILIGKNVPLDRKLEIFKRAKALRAEGTTDYDSADAQEYEAAD